MAGATALVRIARAGLAAALVVGYAASVLLAVLMSRFGGAGATFWTANGFLAGAMILLAHRWRVAVVALCLASQAAISLAIGDGWAKAALFPAVNLVEAALAAWLAIGFCGVRSRRLSWREFALLPLGAIVPATMAGALLGALAARLLGAGGAFFDIWFNWAIPGGVGMVVVLPAILLIPRIAQYREFDRTPLEIFALFMGVGGLTFSIFLQRDLPLQFLIFPALTLVALRLGPPGVAVAAFEVAMIALPLVMAGHGPASLSRGLDNVGRVRLTEFVVVAALFTSLVTAGAVADQARLRRVMIARDRVARAARRRALQAERLAAEARQGDAARRAKAMHVA